MHFFGRRKSVPATGHHFLDEATLSSTILEMLRTVAVLGQDRRFFRSAALWSGPPCCSAR
jgi:hypothetical protein